MPNNLRPDAAEIVTPRQTFGSRTPSVRLTRSVCFVRILILSCLGSLTLDSNVALGSTRPPPQQLKEEGRALFGDPPRPGKGSSKSSDKSNVDDGWVIVLGAFTGDDQEQTAREALARITAQTPLTGARISRKEKASVIEYGRFTDPADPAARAELDRVRAMVVDGEPLSRSFFAPPEAAEGSIPQYDLRNWKNEPLAGAALYTLQIAAYGRSDAKAPTAKERAEFRALAEKAASQLRREGEQAFYYHGPFLSMVTIGLFDESDLSKSFESRRLVELKKRYPNNLLNGKGIRETIKTTDGKTESRLQASRLVALPKPDQ